MSKFYNDHPTITDERQANLRTLDKCQQEDLKEFKVNIGCQDYGDGMCLQPDGLFYVLKELGLID